MRQRIPFAGTSMLAALMLVVPVCVAKPRVQDFIIAGNDGYGTQECLGGQSSCGRIVADAWCEAKGFRNAMSYRAAAPDDITGSVSAASTAKPADVFVITCRD